MFMRNRLARKMAAEMRGATCAGTQTSKAPTLSGPSVTNHYSVTVVQYSTTRLPAEAAVVYCSTARLPDEATVVYYSTQRLTAEPTVVYYSTTRLPAEANCSTL